MIKFQKQYFGVLGSRSKRIVYDFLQKFDVRGGESRRRYPVGLDKGRNREIGWSHGFVNRRSKEKEDEILSICSDKTGE